MKFCRDKTTFCRRKKEQQGRPKTLETIKINGVSIPVYTLSGEQIFEGTPFLEGWNSLRDRGEDMVESCVKLLLLWRFGGVVRNLNYLRSSDGAEFINEVMDFLGDDRVLVEKQTAQAVYSELPCNAVIGTLLTDFAKLPNRSDFSNILERAQELYPHNLYLIPSVEVWDEQKRQLFLPDCSAAPAPATADTPRPPRPPPASDPREIPVLPLPSFPIPVLPHD